MFGAKTPHQMLVQAGQAVAKQITYMVTKIDVL
jgi:hypothetical protein